MYFNRNYVNRHFTECSKKQWCLIWNNIKIVNLELHIFGSSYHVLTKHLRDFRIGLLAAYVDFREAFASVNRDVLRSILALRGITPNLVRNSHESRNSCSSRPMNKLAYCGAMRVPMAVADF